MTNEERFKGAIERRAEYIKYRDFCKKKKLFLVDEFDWLALQHKEELKPCPFCGNNNIDYYETDFGRAEDPFYFVIKCKDCNANIFAENGSLEDAISAWNRRVK